MAKKRGNGEGSITKYKDGRWCGRYTVYTAEGPKRKAVYGRTKAEVRKKLTKAMAQRDTGIVFDADNLNVEEYLERWLKNSVKDNVAHRTFHNYRSQVRLHITPVLGRVKLKSLSPAHIQGLYRRKLDSGLSSSSVRYIHAVLHRALKQAVKWDLVPRNACEAVDAPRPVKKEGKTLTAEQARALLHAARGERFEALYVMALTCGLREGELLGLRWEDVDTEAMTLRVCRQLQRMRDGSGLAFVPTKNKKGRVIDLDPSSLEALRSHRKRQSEEKLLVGSLYQDRGLIFATHVGTPLEASNVVNRSFKPLLKKAGLPNIRFHDLRHTCASLLLSKGIDAKVTQERLGHADIAMTMNTYSHLIPGMQKEAARAIEGLLF